MIPVKQLVMSLRYALKDMQGARISDFELIEVINQAASLLFTHIAEQFVSAGLKKKTLVVDEDGAVLLPSDFVKVHQVGMSDDGVANPETYRAIYEGGYRIAGENFYAPEGVYSLEYYYVPARVNTLDDLLDVPQTMLTFIKDIALALYENNLEGASQIIQVCVKQLAGRELSHFENLGPVKILGGKL